ETVDQLRDPGKVGEVIGELALQVEAQDLEAGLLQRVGGGAADAARGAGDQRCLQPARPGMVKPAAFRSLISSCSWLEVSSTSGGRQVFHCGSLPKCATAVFSAGIIGCFCTILRVAVMPACSWSASADFQIL